MGAPPSSRAQVERGPAVAVLERLNAADRKKYAGRWVAVSDGRVLAAAHSPTELERLIRQKELKAELVFRVPAEGEPTSLIL